MPVKLTDEKKIDILLKLFEENRKQVEWLKDLDFKIVYYTLAIYLAMVAWFSANHPKDSYIPFLVVAIILVASTAVLFLARNHIRHTGLNAELGRTMEALGLMSANEYAEKPLFSSSSGKDWAFHLGRVLYGVAVIATALLTYIFLVNTK
jgi:hypothetical protein